MAEYHNLKVLDISLPMLADSGDARHGLPTPQSWQTVTPVSKAEASASMYGGVECQRSAQRCCGICQTRWSHAM
jgi:hypothetical protein